MTEERPLSTHHCDAIYSGAKKNNNNNKLKKQGCGNLLKNFCTYSEYFVQISVELNLLLSEALVP